MPFIPMPSLEPNSYVGFSAKIKDKNYSFEVRWSEYNGAVFVRISQNGEYIIDDDYPLVCNTIIDVDHRLLPKLFFLHKDGINLKVIRETFQNYGIYYED